MKPSEEKKKILKSYARYTSIAFQMLVIILAGVFGGRELDKWIQTGFPVFTLILTIFSVILAIYSVIKDLLKK